MIDYSSSTLLLLEFSSIVEVCRIFLFFALFLQFGLDKQLCQNDVDTVRRNGLQSAAAAQSGGSRQWQGIIADSNLFCFPTFSVFPQLLPHQAKAIESLNPFCFAIKKGTRVNTAVAKKEREGKENNACL